MSERLSQSFRQCFWTGSFLFHAHVITILIPSGVELLGVVEDIEVPFLEGAGLMQGLVVFPAVVVVTVTHPLRIVMAGPTV
jgi:hypothetical protein